MNTSQFYSWISLLLFFGLLGFWIPLFNNFFIINGEHNKFVSVTLNGTLSTFSLVMLVEGFVNILSFKWENREDKSDSIKYGIYAITLILFFISAYCYSNIDRFENQKLLSIIIIVSTLLAILLSCSLYTFRFKELWIKYADEYINEKDKEVEELAGDTNDNTNALP